MIGRKRGLQREKSSCLSAWCVLGGVFLMLVFLNLFWQEHWLDSDMAAEMIFSKLLAEEGSFLATDSWYYSTEFRVLYTQLFMEPLFFFLDDWHMIRLITNVLTYVLLLAGYFYMIKPLRVKKTVGILTAVLLLLPFSETMMTHVQMGNTYMPHMIIICFVFGMFFRLGEKGQGSFCKRALLTALYLLLCLVCGLSGVRYLLALQVPLVLTCLVYLMKSGEWKELRTRVEFSQIRVLLQAERGRYLFNSILGACTALAGYVLNAAVVASKYDFQTYEVTNFISVYQGVFLERLQNVLGSLLMLFGYISDKGFLSLRGLITMIAFVLLFGILFLTVRTGRLLRERTEKEERPEVGHRRFLLWFFVTAFVLNTFVFIFTTGTVVSRYYITVFLFVPPLLAVYYEEEKLPLDRLLVAAGLFGCMFLATAKIVFSFISVDKNEDKYEVAKYLTEEGYDFGYATYWNANIMTELTDGAVEIANLHCLEDLDYFYWSTPKKYYEEGYHDGKTFLLLTKEEAAEYAQEPIVREGNAVYEDAAYIVYHFDSVEEFEQYGK